MPDARLLASALTLVGASAVGLGVPAPLPKAQRVIEDPTREEPPGDLPDALLRWLEVAHSGLLPGTATAMFRGRGRLRIGRSPWLPVSYRAVHELGINHANELSATWFGRAAVTAVEGLVDGRGVSSVRGSKALGPGMDSGAVSALWSEAVLMPASWTLPGVSWKQNLSHTVQLTTESPAAGPMRATLTFDADSGLPHTFHVADRAKDHTGEERAGWTVTYTDWQESEYGGRNPTRVHVQWDDENRPLLRLTIEPPELGVDVADSIAAVRALLPH